MKNLKKIYKIIILFLLIVLIGVYSFSLYIGTNLDNKNNTDSTVKYKSFSESNNEVSDLNQ